MDNNQLLESLEHLKSEGISYSYIANNCDIPKSTLYYYIKKQFFPYYARKKIEAFIIKEFKEILEDE